MRILFYSPDSYGLGHIRRVLSISERLLSERADRCALILTGAPRAHYFAYPPRCDYVKLPSVTKGTDGRYISREIEMPIDEALRLREGIVESAARFFAPDIFWVDHAPLGLCGEALPALRSLEGTGTLRVLGMRDLIDSPEVVQASWAKDGIVEALRRFYDLIFVYGQKDFFDPIAAYGIPPDVAEKVVFAGYIPRNGVRAGRDDLVTRFAPRTGRLVLVTVGGGGDGDPVVNQFLQGYEALGDQPPFEAVVVTGPLMSPRKRSHFRSWGARLAGLTVMEYSSDLPALIRASDLVVSMGGYNTVCELAYAGAKALLVPRTFPRKEQLLRAQRLAELGVARYVPLEEACPARLMSEVRAGLDRPRPPRQWGLSFSGLKNTAAALARRSIPQRRSTPVAAEEHARP